MSIVEQTQRILSELRKTVAETERISRGFKYDARINYRNQYLIAEAKKEGENEDNS